MDKSEFERLVSSGNYHDGHSPLVRWKGKSFRLTSILEFRGQGPGKSADGTPWSVNRISKTIKEFGLNEAYRESNETTHNGDVTRTESIRVAGVLYSRNDNENWKITKPEAPWQQPDASGGSSNPFEDISTDVEYKYLGTEVFRNATVKTYLATTRKKSVNKVNGTDEFLVSTEKYWLDQDGTTLKSVYRSDGKGVGRTSFTGITMEFVLDSSISITAPNVP